MIIYKGEKSLQLQLIEEIEVINTKIEVQEKNKNICTVYMGKISDYINNANPSFAKNQSQVENTLISLKNICDNVILNLQDLNKLKDALHTFDSIPNENLEEFIHTYNNSHIQIIQRIDKHDVQTIDFTAFLLQNYAFVFSTNNEPLPENTLVTRKPSAVHTSSTNILIISEKDQVAYLPYKIEEVEEYFKAKRKIKHHYSSVQEIIDNKYTIPLSLFKFSTIARFREVFNLIRKENGILEAFETAVELMTNFKLNPIVVRACKNVQELNIFVDCLEEDELDKFPCFEIKYEVAPTVVKKRKNEEFF